MTKIRFEFVKKNERPLRRIAAGVGLVALVACAVRAITRPTDGDFQVHWETGRRFLAGEFLYAGAHDYPYPPLLGMVFAPAALLPLSIAKIVYYVIGTGALFLLLSILQRLVRDAFRLDPVQTFWTSALAVFLAIQFIVRDQAEVGFNTVITALTWSGIYLWRQRRDVLGAASLGLAIAIKCTPAVFVAYFIWKRQWRMAFYTTAAAVVFTILPMARQGPVSWSNHMTAWIANAAHGVSGTGEGFNLIERWQVKNMSLRPALMNYLARVPPESAPATTITPSGVFQLPRGVARWLTNLIFAALIGGFALWCRRPAGNRDDPRLLWELAATGVLMILFAPVAWTQHGVALLPACYLVATLLVRRIHLPSYIWFVVSAFTLVCAMAGRDLIPAWADQALNNFNVATFCVLGLFGVLLAGPRLQRAD